MPQEKLLIAYISSFKLEKPRKLTKSENTAANINLARRNNSWKGRMNA
jgi:hypothetical protein